MSVYTVQAPLGPLGEIDYQRAVFLREGFSFGAFIFGFLWILWQRLWLVALLWLAAYGLLIWLGLTHLSPGSVVLLFLVLRLFLGLEGRALIRQKLAGRHYQLVGVVSATGLEMAERLFFARLPPNVVDFGQQTPPPPPPVPPQAPDVLGLFPQPEVRR